MFYVGRSDSDVKQRLREWAGTPSRHRAYGRSPEAAHAKEWCNCEDFGGSARLDDTGDPMSSEVR